MIQKHQPLLHTGVCTVRALLSPISLFLYTCKGVAVGFIGPGYETRCSELMEKKSSESRRQSCIPRALQGLVDCFVDKTSPRRRSSRCTANANASVKTEERTGARIRHRPYSSDCVHAAHFNGTDIRQTDFH